jgi:hypothetical protein
MRIWPQPSHCSTWPPRVAERQASPDGAHDAALAAAQVAGMGIAVSGTVAAQDIGHLQHAAHQGAQPGGITSRCKPSSGLGVPAIRLVATRV